MSKKNKGTVLNMIERERHRVAASITREQDWEQPEPNSGLARMFVIMLLIHVFVIGGIIIYDFVGGDSTTKSTQASATVAATRASSSSTAAHVSAASLPTVTSSSTNTPSDTVTPAPAPETPKTPALSVPETASNSLMPKALPYTGPLSPSQENSSDASMSAMAGSKPAQLAVAKANTFDPIAFKPDPADHATSDSSVTTTRTSEPVKEKSQPEKAKATPEKAKAPAEKPRVQDKPPSAEKPRPVSTPSAMRKSLEGDSKPPAATSATKKKATTKEESAPPSSKKTTSKSSSPRKYTIVKGDTVYSLARRYKVSEDSIMKANGIKKAGNLGIGKSISIPAAK